jgi:hypothetical protein
VGSEDQIADPGGNIGGDDGKIEVHNSLLNAVLHDFPQRDQLAGGHVVDLLQCLLPGRSIPNQTDRTEWRNFE